MASSRFQNALSLLQKKHKNSWPDPESSVGKFCGTKKGRFKCWKAQGPAHEVFEDMSIEIKELLEKDCGPVPSSCFVHFDIFMIGETPSTAIPHIMFACKKREPRKEALAAVRKSEILSHYTPGIELGHWDYPPYIKDLQFLGSSSESAEFDESTGSTAKSQCHLSPVFDETRPWKVSAMQLHLSPSDNGYGSLQKATVGSVLEVAEKRFYLAPAHIFPGCSITQHIVSDDDIENEDSDCEFGGYESFREEDEVEFMSQYSITPESSDVDSESDFEIEVCSSDDDNEEVSPIEPLKERILDDESSFASVAESDRTAHSTRLEIKSPFFTSVELDCALIEISDNDYLTTTLPTFSRTNVCQIGPGDVDVTTITGSGTALTGIISGKPLYIRFPDTRKYQKVFVVDFADYLQPGDCGSIVRNARTSDIYGHVFAGSVESKVAYIIPAMDLLEVIERNFNVFPASSQDVNSQLQDAPAEVGFGANGEHVPDDALVVNEDQTVPPSSQMYESAPLLGKRRTPSYHDYTIGWICALPVEFDAAREMLDEEHDPLPHFAGDPWSYVLGTIGQHNVVIPNPSSKAFYGQTTSAMTSRVYSTFPNVNIYLAVGISSGSHAPSDDVRLGDVVVGFLSDTNGDINQDNSAKTDSTARRLEKKRILDAVKRHFGPELGGTFLSSHSRPRYPTVEAQVKHSAVNTNQSLEEADHNDKCLKEKGYCCQLESDRGPTLGPDGSRVHHAPNAPSNQVTEDRQMHDIVGRDDVIGFEMEAAGMINLPCLIIRGICDNADTCSRKRANVDWQEYAAAAAAAYARDLLLSVSLEVLRFLCANCAIDDSKYFILDLYS